jgi:hypothetical protein
MSIGADGYLYFTVNQLERQPSLQGGKDLRERPYRLVRVHVGGAPVR